MVPKPPKPVGMELNLAPMVDVMMVLIIFFMLATKLVSAENLPLNLPWAVAAKEIEKKELGKRVVVNIRPRAADPEQTEFVVARLDALPDGRVDIVERAMQPAELTAFLSAASKAARADGEEIRCVIRGDEEIMYRDVEVVLRACGLAEPPIAKIVFSAHSGEGPASGREAGS